MGRTSLPFPVPNTLAGIEGVQAGRNAPAGRKAGREKQGGAARAPGKRVGPRGPTLKARPRAVGPLFGARPGQGRAPHLCTNGKRQQVQIAPEGSRPASGPVTKAQETPPSPWPRKGRGKT